MPAETVVRRCQGSVSLRGFSWRCVKNADHQGPCSRVWDDAGTALVSAVRLIDGCVPSVGQIQEPDHG